MESEAPLISARSVSFSYEETRLVLDRISLEILPGTKHAFVGPNGAGKTTLANLLAGDLNPQSGTISYRNDMRHEDGRLSLAYVRQHLSVFSALTVGQHFRLVQRFIRATHISTQEQRHAILKCLRQVGANFGLADSVSSLSFGQRQLLEIALALFRSTKVIILDEPTSALDNHSVSLLFEALERLSRSGVAIILISHNPAEIEELGAEVLLLNSPETQSRVTSHCDTCLPNKPVDNGKTSASFCIHNKRDSENHEFPLDQGKAYILAFDDAHWRARTWLVAAQHEEDDTLDVFVKHHACSYANNTRQHVRYVSSDKERFGLFPLLSAWSNFALLSRMDEVYYTHRVRKRLDAIVSRYTIDLPSWHHPVSALSGGNQQKLLLACILESIPRTLIAEEFLLGLDRDAQHAVLQCLRDYLSRGGAVIIMTCFPSAYATLSSQVVNISCTGWSA